jgi:hypothetical protein
MISALVFMIINSDLTEILRCQCLSRSYFYVRSIYIMCISTTLINISHDVVIVLLVCVKFNKSIFLIFVMWQTFVRPLLLFNILWVSLSSLNCTERLLLTLNIKSAMNSGDFESFLWYEIISKASSDACSARILSIVHKTIFNYLQLHLCSAFALH